MESRTHEILMRADRRNEWECPSDGDNPWPDIESLVPLLEATTRRTLDIDTNVQDASFVTDIGLLNDQYYDRSTKTGVLYYVFAFRFSNFGRLFTLHGGECDERSDEFRLNDCINLIVNKGFDYISADDLQAPYDGVNGSENPISGEPLTWWTRFFDYI